MKFPMPPMCYLLPALGLLACSKKSEALLDWQACNDDGFECAMLPRGDADIAVMRHLAEGASGTGDSGRVIVAAAGGPGGSSLSLMQNLVEAWAPYDPELWTDVTWVAMDNRGVGESEPISCVTRSWFDELRRQEPVPSTDAAALALGAGRDSFQEGCLEERSQAELAQLGTSTYADDLDAFRVALGQEKLDLLGFSYGTWIGAVYAAAYPDRVGRFVLDGVVAPQTTRDVALAGQARGFEEAFERFFARCEANPDCPVRSDPAGTYDALLAAAAAEPLAAPTDPALPGGGHRTLGHNDLRWAVSTLLYGPDDELLGAGLAEAAAGDATLLLAAADDGWGRDPETTKYDPILARYWAIGCLDLPWPLGWTDEDVWAFGASLELRRRTYALFQETWPDPYYG